MKMKLFFAITGLMTFCSMACSQIVVSNQLESDNKESYSDSTAIEMLRNFYTEYIPAVANSVTEEDERNVDLIKEKYCSALLIKKLKNSKVNYDRLLNAQDANEECLATLKVRKDDSKTHSYIVTYEGVWSHEIVQINLVVEMSKMKYLIEEIQ